MCPLFSPLFLELIGRGFADAEKGGEGMALKISTEAETFSFALT